MTTNRHGTNAHPELPKCPLCGRWAWKNNDVIMGGMTQCFYSCGTDGCNGRGTAIWCGLGLLVLWDGPLVDGCYSVPKPSHEWINAAIKALRAADINGCVHEDKPPPATLVLPPAPGGALHFAGEDWHPIAEGASFDLADQFADRVCDILRRNSDITA